MNYSELLQNHVDRHASSYISLSDKIWEFAEPRFQEYQSSQLLQD